MDAGSARGAQDRYGYASDFGFKGISLEIPTGNLPPEVQQLLQIINQVTTPINQVVDQVVQLLVQVGGTIQIPGLGSLGLGTKKGKTTGHSAESSAYALKIVVDSPVDGSKTLIELGRATSRISNPVPSGVFRTTMSALTVNVGDLLSFGGVSQTSVPCEGTGGKTKSKTIKSASIPGLVSLTDVQYTWSGNQFSRGKGKNKLQQAKGFVQAKIGQVSIPTAGLVINGLTSRVDMKSRKVNAPVRSKASTSVGSISINGTADRYPEARRDGGVQRRRPEVRHPFQRQLLRHGERGPPGHPVPGQRGARPGQRQRPDLLPVRSRTPRRLTALASLALAASAFQVVATADAGARGRVPGRERARRV